mmetsp:Transcript_63815/g.75534  ORF Transcript_63815/g.75534 Transcript_63815/m.75534 type:complete len:204 (-) Transcript_63815:652-1263(-)
MPAPMRPAPRTPTVVTGVAVASPKGCFFMAVMPSKMPMRASLSLVSASLTKDSLSCSYLDRGLSRPCLTQSIIAYGAGYFPLVFLSTISFTFFHIMFRPTGVSSTNQFIQPFFFFFTFKLPSANCSATPIATLSNTAPSATKSTNPIFFALSTRTSFPVSIISIAACNPTTECKFCVPPNPGSKPNFTSGRPNFVFGDALATR